MKIEKGLNDFLTKRYGGDWESIEVIKDDEKSVTVRLDFGDDEKILAVINRRKGYNGNYRIVVER